MEPPTLPLAPPSPHAASRKIGLALGSGASRGLAHIGVIQALEERGVQVSIVAGTSMGAFVGSVYASGNLQRLKRDFLAFDWKSIARLMDPVFPRSGLIDGQKVAAFMEDYASHQMIEDLPMKFCAVATDLLTGAEAVLDSGGLSEAVRASIAVPGLLTPVRRNGQILVDGGLVNPVPVSVVRSMGAERIIAVDVSHDVLASRLARIPDMAAEGAAAAGGAGLARLHEVLQAMNSPVAAQLDAWLHKAQMPGVLDVLLSSLYIMQARIGHTNLAHSAPDLLIRPPVRSIRFMDFNRAEEIIELGYRAAKDALTGWHDP